MLPVRASYRRSSQSSRLSGTPKRPSGLRRSGRQARRRPDRGAPTGRRAKRWIRSSVRRTDKPANSSSTSTASADGRRGNAKNPRPREGRGDGCGSWSSLAGFLSMSCRRSSASPRASRRAGDCDRGCCVLCESGLAPAQPRQSSARSVAAGGLQTQIKVFRAREVIAVAPGDQDGVVVVGPADNQRRSGSDRGVRSAWRVFGDCAKTGASVPGRLLSAEPS